MALTAPGRRRHITHPRARASRQAGAPLVLMVAGVGLGVMIGVLAGLAVLVALLGAHLAA